MGKVRRRREVSENLVDQSVDEELVAKTIVVGAERLIVLNGRQALAARTQRVDADLAQVRLVHRQEHLSSQLTASHTRFNLAGLDRLHRFLVLCFKSHQSFQIQ